MKKLVKVLIAAACAFALAGCGSSKDDSKTIVVGATAVPHAMILNEVVKDVLKEEGWTLEVKEFTDYVMPNTTLEEGEIDANYFQTLGYMEDQNENRGLHLAAAAGVHYEPMTLFAPNKKELKDFAAGDKILVPNDYDNEMRAYELLAKAGLIDYDASLNTPDDAAKGIKDAKGLVLDVAEAASLPLQLDDSKVAGCVINGNYALEGKAAEKANAVYVEELTADQIAKRTNYIVVKAGNEETDKTKALVKAITSAKVKEYIQNTYKTAVICTFE